MIRLICNYPILLMINKAKYISFFLIFNLLSSCSFDQKTGIWSGEKEEKRVQLLEQEQNSVSKVVKLYSTEDVYQKAIKPSKNLILTTPKKNQSWVMSGQNLQNLLGNIYFEGVNKNFLKKKIGKNKFSSYQSTSSILFFDNNIFISDDRGTIFSVNKRGKVNWKKNIYKKIYKKLYKNLSLSIYKNKIFVSDNIGFVYTLNLVNGELLWIKNYNVPNRSNIKIYDGKIFIINQDNRILCLDASTGSLLWNVRSISSFIKSQKLLSISISKKGDVIALLSSGDLLKIKSNTGNMIWSLNLSGSMFAHDTDFFVASDIVIDGDSVIVSTKSSIFSFDINNGYLNWKENINSINTPIIDDKLLFSISDNGYLISIDKTDGKIIWSTNIFKVLKKRSRNTRITGFVMGSGIIYATTANGYLIISSAESGQVKKFIKIGNPIYTAPIISDGALYILTANSKVLGFK